MIFLAKYKWYVMRMLATWHFPVENGVTQGVTHTCQQHATLNDFAFYCQELGQSQLTSVNKSFPDQQLCVRSDNQDCGLRSLRAHARLLVSYGVLTPDIDVINSRAVELRK